LVATKDGEMNYDGTESKKGIGVPAVRAERVADGGAFGCECAGLTPGLLVG